MISIGELAQAAADWKQVQPSTFRMWEVTLRPLADKPIQEFSRADAIQYTMRMRKELKPGTVKTRLGYLSGIWKTGKTLGLTADNPWTDLQEGLQYATKKYEPKILEHFLPFHGDFLFQGLWLHGFRVSELAGLVPEDIVLDTDIPYFNIRHNSTRKCKNDATQRQVPIHPSYKQFLQKFEFSTNPKAGDNFSRRLKKATGTSAHGIRHMFINRMRQAGVEYSIAMAIVGHKAHGQTANYGEISLADKLAALARVK